MRDDALAQTGGVIPVLRAAVRGPAAHKWNGGTQEQDA